MHDHSLQFAHKRAFYAFIYIDAKNVKKLHFFVLIFCKFRLSDPVYGESLNARRGKNQRCGKEQTAIFAFLIKFSSPKISRYFHICYIRSFFGEKPDKKREKNYELSVNSAFLRLKAGFMSSYSYIGFYTVILYTYLPSCRKTGTERSAPHTLSAGASLYTPRRQIKAAPDGAVLRFIFSC